MMTLSTAQENLAALEQLAVGAESEVSITTESGTRRVVYRSTKDLHEQIIFWSRVVADLQRKARSHKTPGRVRFS